MRGSDVIETVTAGAQGCATDRLDAEALQKDHEVRRAIGELIKAVEFDGGSSHSDQYLLSAVDGRRFIAKHIRDVALAGCACPALYEYRGLAIAHERGLAPKPVLLDIGRNLVVMDYVENVVYDALSPEALWTRVELAGRLSELVVPSGHLRILHDGFARDIAVHEGLLREGVRALAADGWKRSELEGLLAQTVRLSAPWEAALKALPLVFGHNDLVAGNVLQRPSGDVVAIDFETAGMSKIDFMIAQLAVDADIDYMLARVPGPALSELLYWIQRVISRRLPSGLLWARVGERLLWNAAYSFRQVALRRGRESDAKYVEEKQRVLEHCCRRLKELFAGELEETS